MISLNQPNIVNYNVFLNYFFDNFYMFAYFSLIWMYLKWDDYFSLFSFFPGIIIFLERIAFYFILFSLTAILQFVAGRMDKAIYERCSSLKYWYDEMMNGILFLFLGGKRDYSFFRNIKTFWVLNPGLLMMLKISWLKIE